MFKNSIKFSLVLIPFSILNINEHIKGNRYKFNKFKMYYVFVFV